MRKIPLLIREGESILRDWTGSPVSQVTAVNGDTVLFMVKFQELDPDTNQWTAKDLSGFTALRCIASDARDPDGNQITFQDAYNQGDGGSFEDASSGQITWAASMAGDTALGSETSVTMWLEFSGVDASAYPSTFAQHSGTLYEQIDDGAVGTPPPTSPTYLTAIEIGNNYQALTRVSHWSVVDATLTTPPALSGGKAAYIVGAGATGAWSGQDGKIAMDHGSWTFYSPSDGWFAYDRTNDEYYYNVSSTWTNMSNALDAVGDGSNLTTQYRGVFVSAAGKVTESSTITTDADGDLNITGADLTIDSHKLENVDTTTLDIRSSHATRSYIRFSRLDGTALARHGAYDVDQPAVANNDASKVLIFGVGNIGATPRTLTMPDRDLDLGGAVLGYSNIINAGRLNKTSTTGTITEATIAEGSITGLLTISKTGATARTITFPDAAIVVTGSASALTSGRVPVATTGGLLTDSANLAYDGTTFSVGGGSTIGSEALNITGNGVIRGANVNPGVARIAGTLQIESTDATANDVGASIGLGGITTGTTPWSFASIKGARESANNGYLAFFTTASLNNQERVRISSTGSLLIGATSLVSTEKLHVAGSYYGTGQFKLSTNDTVAATITQTDTTNGYGLVIESAGSAATRYALLLRNPADTVYYGGVSTATGQVGYWAIGFSPTGTVANALTVSGAASIGASYTGTTAPTNGLLVEGATLIGATSTVDSAILYANGISVFGGPSHYSKFEADGTLVFNGDATVWEDANIDLSPLQTGGTAPGFATIASTNIRLRSFDVGEDVDGSLEIPHSYKLSSDITAHIHFLPTTAPTGTDYVKFELEYYIVNDDGTVSTSTTIDTGDIAVDTQWKRVDANFTTTISNASLGGQLAFKIKRVAATGDAYGGECAIQTFGFHYEADMAGSRQITTK